MGTDDGVRISGAARLAGLYFMRTRDVLAQIPALEGGRPRGADMRQSLLTCGFLDEVFAGETEDPRGGYEVTAIVTAEITDVEWVSNAQEAKKYRIIQENGYREEEVVACMKSAFHLMNDLVDYMRKSSCCTSRGAQGGKQVSTLVSCIHHDTVGNGERPRRYIADVCARLATRGGAQGAHAEYNTNLNCYDVTRASRAF